jgi:dienelactone hydrolase
MGEESPFGPSGAARKRPKRRVGPGRASGGDLLAVLHERKLALAVGAAGLVAFLVIALLGAPLAGLVVGAIGGGVAAMGFSARMTRQSRSESINWGKFWASLVASAGVSAGIGGWLSRDFRHVEIQIGFFVFVVLIGVLGTTISLLGKPLFRRFGPFRIAASTYLGAFALFMVVGLSGMFGLVRSFRPLDCLENPSELFVLDDVPLPGFPERGTSRMLKPGVDVVDVDLEVSGSRPGHYGRLRIYTPYGSHAPGSLPCVLIAPAGTNMISGTHLGDDPDHPERVPYVEAGFAVVAFELDGEYESEEPTNVELIATYREYAAARAGLVNARNALEYVLAKMPEVDPERIYVAGHSSAGTLSLLFAAHEPRLRGCVAFAPVTDLEKSFGEEAEMFARVLPGGENFLVKASPITHASSLKCPVFLFHADDDTVVYPSQTYALSNKLQGMGADVDVSRVPYGNHYDAMIDEGIPRAIAWLQRLQPAREVASAETSAGDVASSDRPAEADETAAASSGRPGPGPRHFPPSARDPRRPPLAHLPPGIRGAMPGSAPSPRPGAHRPPPTSSTPGAPSSGAPSSGAPSGGAPSAGNQDAGELIERIRSSQGDLGRLLPALHGLANVPPDEARREEVAGLLEPLLTDDNRSVAGAALRAVGVWGTKRNVPTLLACLESDNTGTRWDAMKALGELQAPEAVEPLVRRVAVSSDAVQAARALQSMGPMAEDAVIGLLAHEEFLARMKACNILEEIGGPNSIAALEEHIRTEEHFAAKSMAERAVEKLRAR